ncbi:MAG: TetR/AcrR family transcriptional regulator [Nitrospirae bacterium]|nr:TetR/AcrR family transcriptional regulator [Magnetococcales bacterium]HAT49037.1 TetR/AcrR family transcriptional regulator [Alphaproteobacteria bacterium]
MAIENTSRERLLASAKILIHSRGYADVGVQELCSHAGIKKGSFYHFFPSKQALTLAALDEMMGEIKQRVFVPAFSKEVPPLERIRRFFRLSHVMQCDGKLETGCVLGCSFGNLALELGTREEEIRTVIEGLFAMVIANFRDTLEEAIATGDLPPGIDTDATAQALLAFLEGILMIAKNRNDPDVLLGQEEMALRLCRV